MIKLAKPLGQPMHSEKKSIPDTRHEVVVRLLTYNVREYVVRAIESALSQFGVDFIILAYDDCSSDGTYEILLDYEERFPEKVFVSRPAVSTFQTSDWGSRFELLRESDSEFIALLDGDDFWHDPMKLQRSVEFLRSKDLSAVSHPISIFIDSPVNTKGQDVWRYWSRIISSTNNFSRVLRANLISYPTSSLLIRTRDFPFDLMPSILESKAPDLLMKYHLVRKRGIGFLPTELGTYRLRSDSLWQPKSSLWKLLQTLHTSKVAHNIWGLRGLWDISKHTFLWSSLTLVSKLRRNVNQSEGSDKSW